MIRPIHLLTWLPAVTLLICFSPQAARGQESSSEPFFSSPLPLSSQAVAEYARYDVQRQETRELIRQRVQFEAQQRVLREQWYQWIGYSPSRPTVNSSYMSSGTPHYYVPRQGRVVNSGPARALYW